MNESGVDQIRLSIVIAAWNGDSLLRQCLESVENQTDRAGTEVVVVSNFPVPEIELSLPVKFILLDETATVPVLRQNGINAAQGEIVALAEDHCLFDAQWCREIKKAHESPYVAIGGSVENNSVENALDWAVYFYDYGKYMPPNQNGPMLTLSGMNVSYKKIILQELAEFFEDGFFETNFNDELEKRGYQLMMESSAIIYHNKSYKFGRAISHSFHLARAYAARRVGISDVFRRFYFIAGSVALPVILPTRIILVTLKKGRHISSLLRSLPYLVFLMFMWSFGEFCGYIIGEGDSTGEWR